MPATPDPDLALRLAKALVDVYSEASGHMLGLVAKRLARGIDSPGWAERKLIEQAQLRDEAIRVLNDLQRDGAEAIEQAITKAYAVGVDTAVADLKVLGGEGRLTAQFGMTHTRAVEALVQETVTRVQSTHLQILRSTVDNYRNVISEVSTPGVVTGTQTRREATQRALDRFAAKGITGFTDKAGRQWELETYAEMATRTSVGRAQTQGTLDRFVAAGRDLVIVSDAPQECSVCRPFEGKILSISGATPTGTTLQNGFTVTGTVAEATGAGLFHNNCRHALSAYIDGATRRMTNTEDPEGDRVRQEQRALERNVRKWKRVAGAQLPENHPSRKMQQAAQSHVREAQKALREHVEKHDLKRLRYREQVGRAR